MQSRDVATPEPHVFIPGLESFIDIQASRITVKFRNRDPAGWQDPTLRIRLVTGCCSQLNTVLINKTVSHV